MAVEVVFYSLAPKPATNGSKTYAAAAAGKVSRGRKWYRLECRPCDAFVFPDGADESTVLEWLGKYPDTMQDRVAFTVNGKFHYMVNDITSGNLEARDYAVSMYEKGREGWVVFVPEM